MALASNKLCFTVWLDEFPGCQLVYQNLPPGRPSDLLLTVGNGRMNLAACCYDRHPLYFCIHKLTYSSLYDGLMDVYIYIACRTEKWIENWEVEFATIWKDLPHCTQNLEVHEIQSTRRLHLTTLVSYLLSKLKGCERLIFSLQVIRYGEPLAADFWTPNRQDLAN